MVAASRRAEQFVGWALANPANARILERLPQLGVQQCFLTAGCLFQAAWNTLSGRAPADRVKDYDVFYFDDADLSWEAEDAVIRRAARLFGDLGVTVEVRNQARVHLWFKQRFGSDYPQLRSAQDGIDRYLVACTCIGIEAGTRRLYAPNGLDEVWDGILRMNPVQPAPRLFRRKAADYQARWPWLTVIPPDDTRDTAPGPAAP